MRQELIAKLQYYQGEIDIIRGQLSEDVDEIITSNDQVHVTPESKLDLMKVRKISVLEDRLNQCILELAKTLPDEYLRHL